MENLSALSMVPFQKIINESAKILNSNYERYWPKRGTHDPNERDLTMAIGIVLYNDGYTLFNEVPIKEGHSSNKAERIDLVTIAKDNSHALLIESKNIEVSKSRKQVAGDFRKMNEFTQFTHAVNKISFPSSRFHITLMLGWTKEGIYDPFEKHEYKRWLINLKNEFDKNEIIPFASSIKTWERPFSDYKEYQKQWLICLVTKGPQVTLVN